MYTYINFGQCWPHSELNSPVSTCSFSSTHWSMSCLNSRSDSDLEGGRNLRENSDCGCIIVWCGVPVVCSMEAVMFRGSSSSGPLMNERVKRSRSICRPNKKYQITHYPTHHHRLSSQWKKHFRNSSIEAMPGPKSGRAEWGKMGYQG